MNPHMMRCGQKALDARREMQRIVEYSQGEQRGTRRGQSPASLSLRGPPLKSAPSHMRGFMR
jgi:hypothetical protein